MRRLAQGHLNLQLGGAELTTFRLPVNLLYLLSYCRLKANLLPHPRGGHSIQEPGPNPITTPYPSPLFLRGKGKGGRGKGKG